MRILQRNLKRTTDTFLFISHTTNVLLFKFRCNIFIGVRIINPLTPNDPYRGRTAPITSKRCILYIYSTNIGTEYFKHGLYSPFFLFSKCSLFHNSNVFGSCIIHILYTGCAKIKKKSFRRQKVKEMPGSVASGAPPPHPPPHPTKQIESLKAPYGTTSNFNPLDTDLNLICPLLTFFRAHHILHVSR